MISNTELRYLLALQRALNIGDILARRLIAHVGSAEGVFKEKKHKLAKIPGIGSFALQGLDEKLLLDAVENELKFASANAISIVTYQDEKYPKRLKHCADAPLAIFHKGALPRDNAHVLSVVGTRNITTYGKVFCDQLIEDLRPLDPVIISGFAYGVDIRAHLASVRGGLSTIGCLAHGFDQWYPKPHRNYVGQILERGGFITEFWSDDSFDRSNFLKRNRIIAGISEATIVIESGEKGGSLVTADIANSYNRDVFAVPGRVNDMYSKGCNNLIRNQTAQMITSAADVIYLLGWNLERAKTLVKQTKLFEDLTAEEKSIYDYLHQHGESHLDSIALDCGLPSFKVASLLLTMELKGVVVNAPGKLFSLR